jgi:hypothetical protein
MYVRKRILGNEQYGLGRYETAAKTYSKAIAAIRSIDDGERSRETPVLDKDEKKQHLFPLFLNSAA